MFQLYAYGNCTIDGVIERLTSEAIIFRDTKPRWTRSTVHSILNDRSYIGEVKYKENWYPGKQEVLIERGTWDRVQTLLGNRQQVTHSLTFAGDLIKCGHCGHMITGEWKVKQTKSGARPVSIWSEDSTKGHPRTRVRELDLDAQVLGFFDCIRIQNDSIRDWFRAVLASKVRDVRADITAQRAELKPQESMIAGQQDRLLNPRIENQTDESTFAKKSTEVRNRLALITLQLQALNRGRDAHAE